jgi:hypothetical protein
VQEKTSNVLLYRVLGGAGQNWRTVGGNYRSTLNSTTRHSSVASRLKAEGVFWGRVVVYF